MIHWSFNHNRFAAQAALAGGRAQRGVACGLGARNDLMAGDGILVASLRR